ncbi:hypothetical protein JAAARDRAFT_36669 [Jaapia argillacea MUCL 33604]|uniref:Uncharacterized protein n=1 Tax=Jaapia argillacea MUCL 33604 TaxID=933084 RepID=A0A067PQ22_9AGAM|nr:hypothetical protein JAAARDRAFT_36669 [Jaapia argillacea MUCL 33604]
MRHVKSLPSLCLSSLRLCLYLCLYLSPFSISDVTSSSHLCTLLSLGISVSLTLSLVFIISIIPSSGIHVSSFLYSLLPVSSVFDDCILSIPITYRLYICLCMSQDLAINISYESTK